MAFWRQIWIVGIVTKENILSITHLFLVPVEEVASQGPHDGFHHGQEFLKGRLGVMSNLTVGWGSPAYTGCDIVEPFRSWKHKLVNRHHINLNPGAGRGKRIREDWGARIRGERINRERIRGERIRRDGIRGDIIRGERGLGGERIRVERMRDRNRGEKVRGNRIRGERARGERIRGGRIRVEWWGWRGGSGGGWVEGLLEEGVYRKWGLTEWESLIFCYFRGDIGWCDYSNTQYARDLNS